MKPSIGITQEAAPYVPPTPTGKRVTIQWYGGWIQNSSSAYVDVNTSSSAITCNYGNEGTSFSGFAYASQTSAVLGLGADTNYSVIVGNDGTLGFELAENLCPEISNSWTFVVEIRKGSSTGQGITSMGWTSYNIPATQYPNLYPYVDEGDTLYLIPSLLVNSA